MSVQTNITHKDFLRGQFYFLLRSKKVWFGFSLLWALFFIPLFNEFDPEVRKILLIPSLIVSVIPTIFCCIVIIAASFISELMIASKSHGMLGQYQAVINEDGLVEVASGNEVLTQWNGITNLTKTKSFIFVHLGRYLHMISRDSFDSQDEYDTFWNALFSKWNSSHT